MPPLSRRAFSLGLGASLLGGGLLRGLERTALAATGPTAKRLLVYFVPNGTIHQHWRPSGSGANFSFPAGSILEPLTAHQDKLVICDGIDFKGVANHEPGMAAMLTGGGSASTVGGGASIDQYIAGHLAEGYPRASIELSVKTNPWGASNQTRMLYSSPGVYVHPNENPADAYQLLFGNAGSAGPSPKAMRRQSVLDTVRGELKTLEKAVGVDEQHKLEQHLLAIGQLEAGLTNVGLCAGGDPIEAVSGIWDDANVPLLTRLQIDLMVASFACGMSRVGSIQLSHTVSPVVLTWLGHTDNHHSLSHKDDGNAAGVAQFVEAERWFAGEFAYLLERLEETDDLEFGGKLLDNTLVVWAKEMGDGRMHDCLSVPFVLAGGGVFPPGRTLDFGGAPHQQLLVSICHAMGLQNMTYGDPTHGVGPLPGLLT